MQFSDSRFLFSIHCLKAMVERNINAGDIIEVIRTGKIIKQYEHDKPYPSFLLLKFVNERPIHVVVANNITDKVCVVVTCYEPSEDVWDIDFKNKIK
jgi:hypothetical protein